MLLGAAGVLTGAVAVLVGHTVNAAQQTAPGINTSTKPETTPTTGGPQPTGAPQSTTPRQTATTGAPGPATSTKPHWRDGTATGPEVQTPFGPVQVRVTVKSGRIVDVVALETPAEHRRSIEINQYAGPILRQEVLTAQSADIDVVSGATYTTEGYAESLQAALDSLQA
jgi:uncharacterized protein with FMN-binding domain